VPPNVRSLTIFLLKDDRGLPRSALKEPNALARYAVKRTLPFKGTLWVRADDPRPASWGAFVQPGIIGELKATSATSSAVLILESSGRMFAITFGYGRSLLMPGAYERDFGLKVTLNTVKPESLRSIDAHTFETLTLRTRRQTSRAAPLEEFGLNVSQDLIRAAAGEPRELTFARRVAGSDAVVVAAAVEFDALAVKCSEVLDAYGKDTYRERFSFIDRLRKLNDPNLLTRLEETLLRRLRLGETDRMHLAAPDLEDPERVDGFSYTTRPDRVFVDLDLEEFLQTIGQGTDKLTLATLKRNYVRVHYAEGVAQEKWTVFDALTAELDLDDALYILSVGDWFEAERAFASEVASRMDALGGSSLALPPARRNEKENSYNRRAARAHGHALLDMDLARCSGAATPIEVCDFFTAQRQFVHVKRKTRSATLSHLFAQGVVSAEAFLWDGVFRQDVKDKIESANTGLAQLIPPGRPSPSEFAVGYAIITPRAAGWPRNLPFFSQVNLRNAADRLERLGYGVSLTRIDERL
jgi:uncharacterized protein (TIGR04141 family)